LTADPVPGVHDNALFDEGGWAHNARNRVVFGHWIMDENNASLFAAPLYSATLAGVYALTGVGLAETRLLSAAAGIISCLLIFGFLRRHDSEGRALAVSLVLGCSYFMLSNNRVGFTESFQLVFILASAGGVLMAEKRPGWAVFAGASFAAALLTKPSAIFLGAVFLVFWLSPGGARRGGWKPPIRTILLFAAGCAIPLAGTIGIFAASRWAEVKEQLFTISWGTAFIPTRPEFGRMPLLGWSGWGMTPNGFFRQTLVPLTAVLLLAMARIGRSASDSRDSTERLCWSWLGVSLLLLGIQQYQPDRRFLFLLPPVAYLAVIACRAGGVLLPSRNDVQGAGRLRRIALGALLGGFVGFFLSSPAGPAVRRVVVKLSSTMLDPTIPQARAIFWNVSILAGALIVMVWPALFPKHQFRIPVAALLPAFLLLEPIRFAAALLHPTYTVIGASRAVSAMERQLPTGRNAMEGELAATLALETSMLDFYRRDIGTTLPLNRDGFTRFHPVFQVVAQALPLRSGRSRPPAEGFVPCREFRLWPDRAGEPRWLAMLYAQPGSCPSPSAP
jgi:4-amino-4-deoxy-L-arabinose transferase-like glycosyltransferase